MHPSIEKVASMEDENVIDDLPCPSCLFRYSMLFFLSQGLIKASKEPCNCLTRTSYGSLELCIRITWTSIPVRMKANKCTLLTWLSNISITSDQSGQRPLRASVEANLQAINKNGAIVCPFPQKVACGCEYPRSITRRGSPHNSWPSALHCKCLSLSPSAL